ncbi:hypothetical protein J6590_047104 [Homalodisca vitripennis]|nr:hypothetical protein J6590_047104 [Homalodisca vitripennis]
MRVRIVEKNNRTFELCSKTFQFVEVPKGIKNDVFVFCPTQVLCTAQDKDVKRDKEEAWRKP